MSSLFTGRFQQFDYGLAKNFLQYGRIIAPVYNLTSVTAPGYIVYAKNDYIVDADFDIPRLCKELGNCLEKYLVPTEHFNHLDFTYGLSAPTLIFKYVRKVFEKN